jgi:hypothetical protein
MTLGVIPAGHGVESSDEELEAAIGLSPRPTDWLRD